MTSNADTASLEQSPRPASITRPRFWLVAASLMLALTIIGFAPFYLRGNGFGERSITPWLVPLVVVHGVAMTGWIVLLVVQTGLVTLRSVRTHMLVGAWSMAIAALSATSGIILAYASILDAPGFPFWGRPYWQFGPSMFTEMLVFSGFVAAGYFNRKILDRHRALMLLAGIAVLSGATVRIPATIPLFGDSGWLGVFGPAALFGFVLAAIRFGQERRIDRWFTGGFGLILVAYTFAWWAGGTSWWAAIVAHGLGIAIA
ncbi:hypothetical protein J3454_10780 [Erythrobacter sp. NFXS35]|uniref:hypothetical protein n=1 Tax=Erythrobacter sp. NFXS35 TaxID=2818436 RepID=UPI0032DE3B8F